jgi:flagellar hook-associated protein 3 FlgL
MSGWATIFNNTQAMLQVQGQALAKLQEQATSGLRINRPSDAPADAFQVLQQRAEVDRLTTLSKNLGGVLDARNTADGIFQSLSTTLSRARTLASQAASGTYSPADRKPMASEIDSLLEQAVALANTKFAGENLFGGGAAGQAYVAQYQDGHIVGVNYTGAARNVSVPVADGVSYAANWVGSDAFQSSSRQAPTFYGNTGVKAGDGTSNVRGDVWLTATHTLTTYAGASGVTAGDSSVSGDTILGSHYTLTVDEPSHTIKFGDGATVAFTGTETDLRLTNAAGDVVYVNTQNVKAGYTGSEAVTPQGTFSIDDGASTAPIGLTGSDAVTDSRTGRVLYVNSADIARTGLEPVRVYGTYDLFGALVSVRDAILNTRQLSDAGQMTEIDKAMDALTEVTEGLTQTATANGAQIQAMTSLKDSMTSRQTTVTQEADATQSVDVIELASDLARRQVLYQLALTSASKLLSMSLFTTMPA